jgi:photosystem II stability/assembly factor-like uncharacterized protein
MTPEPTALPLLPLLHQWRTTLARLLLALPLLWTSAVATESSTAGAGPVNATGSWVNVAATLAGDSWGAYGVHYLTTVPHSSAVIAGVSERGLWLSRDGGTTWTKLGVGDLIKHRPTRIIFDPTNPAIFWECGIYGAGMYFSKDAGTTIERLGNLDHVDDMAVDFSDPKRSTLLAGLHEQARSLNISHDGGRTWTKIGDKFPADSNFTHDPIILDSTTFLVNTAGWKQNASLGIYRSQDAGETWTRISTIGPSGTPLVATSGTILWQGLWGSGVVRSTDRGTTWNAPIKPVNSVIVELPAKRLAGYADSQVMISSDDGVTWTTFGPKIPFKPNGLAYSAAGKAFYAYHLTDKKDPQAIVRLGTE